MPDARGIIAPVVEPIARACCASGDTPDMVTLIGAAITVTSAILLIPRGHFIPAIIILLFFLFGDVLDGTMARLSGHAGPWGAFLDSTLDRVADGAVFGAFLWWCGRERRRQLTVVLAWLVLAGAVRSATRRRAPRRRGDRQRRHRRAGRAVASSSASAALLYRVRRSDWSCPSAAGDPGSCSP